jgi:hypothetical protein
VPASEVNLRKELRRVASCFLIEARYRIYTARSKGTAVKSTVVSTFIRLELVISIRFKVGSCMTTNCNREFL